MSLVIFDLGDVIMLGFRSLKQMAEEFGIDVDEFKADYKSYNAALMDGWCTTADYYRHLEIKYGVKINTELFIEGGYNPVINVYLMDKVEALSKAGHRVVIGSNTFECYDRWNRENLPILYDSFSNIYLSYLIHRCKPDASFWLYIMEKEGFEPKDTYFIDDRNENVDTAVSLGITTLLYDGDNEKAEKFLNSLF